MNEQETINDGGGRPTHLEARGILKSFGGAVALRGINLNIERDTFHALVGENGAGKSTLGRIFAGLHRPTEGEILVNGKSVRLRGPADALASGVTMVVQERSIVPALTVLENVFLNRESGRVGFHRKSEDLARYREICNLAGFWLRPAAKAGTLSAADQLRVEILRALARDVELLVLDEVTAALAPDEAEAFFVLLGQLRDRGRTIVYITHFLSEVMEFADRVTIMRDGEIVRTAPASAETPQSLVSGMLGRPLESVFPDKAPVPSPQATTVLEVRGLTRSGTVDDVSLEIRAGEILGMAGLVGSGRSEIARLIFGADHAESGEVRVRGEAIRRLSPGRAIQKGVALVPESRQHEGLVLKRAVSENLTLANLDLAGRGGLVGGRREKRTVRHLMERFSVRAASPALPVGALSGGNQQKVLFAKWLAAAPKVLIVDEPTRGVDVGAKHAIYELLNDYAAQGGAVLLISSELDEVLNLAHRVVVVRKGAIVGEFAAEASNKEAVLQAAFGTTGDVEASPMLEEVK